MHYFLNRTAGSRFRPWSSSPAVRTSPAGRLSGPTSPFSFPVRRHSAHPGLLFLLCEPAACGDSDRSSVRNAHFSAPVHPNLRLFGSQASILLAPPVARPGGANSGAMVLSTRMALMPLLCGAFMSTASSYCPT
jgi:hypothetical protein